MIGKTSTNINARQLQANTNNGFSLENSDFIDILEMDLQKFRSQFSEKHEEPAIDHSKILNSLFEQINEVDFREEAGFTNEDQKLSKKHYLVLTRHLLTDIFLSCIFDCFMPEVFLYSLRIG